MRTAQTLVWAGVLLIAGVLVPCDPASAKSSKTPIDVYEVDCLVESGVTWFSGKDDKLLHTRGQVGLSTLYDTTTLEVTGANWIVSNSTVNTETGDGQFHGTFSITLIDLPGGTFDGTWNGKLSGGLDFLGRAVGHGTAELSGLKSKLTIRSETGFFPAEPPCNPLDILGVFRDTGFIHSPHGN